MASIYDTVPAWNSASTYNKYNIVLGSDNKYYYSIIDSNSGASNNPTNPANLQVEWDGYIVINGNLTPNFFWKPSYNIEAISKPRVKINQFGNGYQQRIFDGINVNLIEFNIIFENRSELETVSILHFLQQMNTKQSFIYNLPTIYSKSTSNLTTMFICPEWSASFVSYNNYSVKANFIEVPK
jgi:phage-related protein